MSKYLVAITADQNDADYVTSTNVVDLNDKVFGTWVEPYSNLDTTYAQLFRALSAVLIRFDKDNINAHNWSDCTRRGNPLKPLILDALSLEIDAMHILSREDLDEALWDFIPGTSDYPIHTITNIVIHKIENSIKLY